MDPNYTPIPDTPIATVIYEEKYFGDSTREEAIGNCCCLVLWVPSMFGIMTLIPGLNGLPFYATFCCISSCSTVIGKECAKSYVKYNN